VLSKDIVFAFAMPDLGDGGALWCLMVGDARILMVWRSFCSKEMLGMQELATWGDQ
jgi:hypothetical protein